jgi:Ca2+-transporting ATPase
MPRRPLPLDRLGDLWATDHGLTGPELAERRTRYGANDILSRVSHPWWSILANTASDPMLWFLLVTSLLYALLGDRLEAALLASAMVPLAAMDAYLHRRTSASTEGLQSRLAARAHVRRDGVVTDVPAAELVPGDLVVVAAGAFVPADGVVIAAHGLQMDESSLFGESLPVTKRVIPSLPAPAGALPSVDFDHWLFAGTRVLTGGADLRLAYTGGETLYGEIVRSVRGGATLRTPAQRAIAALVALLTAVAGAFCLVLWVVRLHQGFGWIDATMSALTLAVAALPEEFPVVFTFFLGVGVYRLARRRALVRRAAAVEHVGRVTTICSDKTGTITEGRLALADLVPADGGDPAALLALAAQAARAESGDPLDVAILAASAARSSRAPEPGAATRVAVHPFTEDRKRETAVLRLTTGDLVAVSKGAPEVLLELSDAAAAERRRWLAAAADLAARGYKVIACAQRALAPQSEVSEPGDGFRMAGLLGFTDPIRPGVVAAVRECRAAGIRPIMLTGDHPVTALAVAREIGLATATTLVLTGDDVAARLAAHPNADLSDVAVVARATPAQKLAVVRTLQRAGECVAVTGDGVNDVPALQTADVGIAMGERGTQSAREVASIVLLDDDFATIVAAIAEGRQLFRNLQASFRYLLTIHLPLLTTAALIPLGGYPLLYLPIHIVWLELVIHPTALLAFQAPAEAARLAPLPRERDVRLFSSAEWLDIALIGVALTTLVGGGYLGTLDEGSPVEHARAFALVTLSFASAALAALGSGLRTRASRVVTLATVGLTLTMVQTPALARHLHVLPLHANDLGAAAFATCVVAALSLVTAKAAARRPSLPREHHGASHGNATREDSAP